MPLETVTNALRVTGYILLATWWLAVVLRARAVDTTAAQYWLTTLAIILTVANVLCDVARSIIALMQSDLFEAGSWIACAVLMSYVSKRLFDDNNWFNDQFKKLKKLGSRLRNIRITLPSPMPSPA